MSLALKDLLVALNLEDLGDDRFAGHSPDAGWTRIFGGLVVAQALVATSRTTDKPIHSLHSYFMLPGDPSAPVEYHVERIREGRSFATRLCRAVQGGRDIFSLLASFQSPEAGLDHGLEMPPASPPHLLMSARDGARDPSLQLPEGVRRYFERERPVDLRPVSIGFRAALDPGDSRKIWLRAEGTLPGDQVVHDAVLAYLSDMTLLDVALAPHGRSLFDGGFQAASLDHSMWFHRRAKADDWLLYDQKSPSASGGRGLCQGFLFQEGALVVTVMQEGLIRQRA